MDSKPVLKTHDSFKFQRTSYSGHPSVMTIHTTFLSARSVLSVLRSITPSSSRSVTSRRLEITGQSSPCSTTYHSAAAKRGQRRAESSTARGPKTGTVRCHHGLGNCCARGPQWQTLTQSSSEKGKCLGGFEVGQDHTLVPTYRKSQHLQRSG